MLFQLQSLSNETDNCYWQLEKISAIFSEGTTSEWKCRNVTSTPVSW